MPQKDSLQNMSAEGLRHHHHTHTHTGVRNFFVKRAFHRGLHFNLPASYAVCTAARAYAMEESPRKQPLLLQGDRVLMKVAPEERGDSRWWHGWSGTVVACTVDISPRGLDSSTEGKPDANQATAGWANKNITRVRFDRVVDFPIFATRSAFVRSLCRRRHQHLGGGVASGDVASATALPLPSLPSSVSSASSSLSLSSERCFTLRLPKHVIGFIFSFIFETVVAKGNAWVGFREKEMGACLELLPSSPRLAHYQFSISTHLDSVWVLLRANPAALDEPTSHWRTRVATTQRSLLREMVLGLGQTATLFFGGDGDEGVGDHGDGGDGVVNGDCGRRGGARGGVSLESIDVCDFVPLGARPIARSHLAKLLEVELYLPRKEEADGGDDIRGGGGRSDGGGSSSCCGGSGGVRTEGSTRTNGGVDRSAWNNGSAPEETKHARGDAFVRTHMVEPIQRALQREVVAAEYHVDLLRRVYEELRVGHRGMYMAILNGVRAEPQFGAFERRATALSVAADLRRVVGGSGGNGGSSGTAEIGGSGVGGVGSSSVIDSTVVRQTRTAIRQKQTSIQGLYTEARAVLPMFHSFLAALASKTSAVLQVAPLKRPFRSLEKAAVRKGDGSGDVSGNRSGGGGGGGGQRDECGNVDCVLDVVRGQLVFHDLNMMLACLELLASATSDPVGRRDAKRRGWDARAAGIDQAIKIHRVKNRFAFPTSGGWADGLVSFSFDDENDDEEEGGGGHICELQLVHSQMMTVRSCSYYLGRPRGAMTRWRPMWARVATVPTTA